MLLLKDVGNETAVLLMTFSDFHFSPQSQAQPLPEEKKVLFNSVIWAEQCAFVVRLSHSCLSLSPSPRRERHRSKSPRRHRSRSRERRHRSRSKSPGISVSSRLSLASLYQQHIHCKKNMCHPIEVVAQVLNPADRTAAYMKAELENSFNGCKIVLSRFSHTCQEVDLSCFRVVLALSSTIGHWKQIALAKQRRIPMEITIAFLSHRTSP